MADDDDRRSGADPGDSKRQADGKFGSGNNANPGGRPKALKEVQDLAAAHTGESIKCLVTIMRRGLKKPVSAQRMSQARQAAVAILDRGWGRPAQPISGVPDQPVGIDVAGDALVDLLKKIAGEE